MEQNIHEQIEKRIAELPEDVRQAITASDFDEKVRAIATKHSLHIDQAGVLGDEIMLAMLGFTKLDTLGTEIAAQLNIAPAEAQAIVAEANEQIFLSIRESIKNFTAKLAPAPAQPAETPAVPAVAPAPLAAPAPSMAPVPAPKLVDIAAETILTQKTTSVAPVAEGPATAPQPAPYKATDPYREPPE